MIERLNYLEINSKAIDALFAAKKHVSSIDDKLCALLELRVSQINGCVYCVDLHATQARDAGETQQRLDCLAAWRECRFFEENERAALAWAEAVTLLPDTHAPDDLFLGLKEHFSERQIVDLTLIVSLMNAWNRLAVGFRHLPDARG
jgi:AhpD family alkylhydroperoxidase